MKARASTKRAGLRWAAFVLLTLVWLDTWALPGAETANDALPPIGQPLLLHGIRVTLLGVEQLGRHRLETPHGLAAGGLRIVWLVENRQGEPLAPVLGNVRVFFGGRLYNPVTNAISRKPFAPDMMIYEARQFFEGAGKTLESFAPTRRPNAVATVLEVYVRGNLIPPDVQGVAEIELGYSPVASTGGGVRYEWFRFQLPRL